MSVSITYNSLTGVTSTGAGGVCGRFRRAWHCGLHVRLNGVLHARRESSHLLLSVQPDSSEGEQTHHAHIRQDTKPTRRSKQTQQVLLNGFGLGETQNHNRLVFPHTQDNEVTLVGL